MDELEHGNQGLVDRIRTIRIQLDELSSMIEKKKRIGSMFLDGFTTEIGQ